ncbi:MAG TPA: winged helix DNA-binding domain-containing protein [Cyclobacteriaceae bacterium]
MTDSSIARLRLSAQKMVTSSFTKPEEVVGWLGAVQAQDFLGSLWAIGQRMKATTETDIEQAIEEKRIIRTWPMRGTLHFVLPEDVRWMLKLLTPRVFTRAATNYRQAGLDKTIFNKSRKLLENTLRDREPMTRDEVYDVLERAKISTGNTRGLHITGYLAMEGVLCLGPRRGKQSTLTLLDQWIPDSKLLSVDESLAELATRYFISHGPATLADFVWWSGLAMKDATKGLELVKSKLVSETINDQVYWMSNDLTLPKSNPNQLSLIPAYDEFLVGYKDRSASVNSTIEAKVRNSIFSPAIIHNGQLIGTWKRTIQKKDVSIELIPYSKLSSAQQNAIAKEAKRYSRFIGLPLET